MAKTSSIKTLALRPDSTPPTQPPAMSTSASISDPAIPPSDGRCFLLSLPRELRDEIWGYTLLEPNGLFYRYKENDRTFKLHATPSDDNITVLDSNRLKYVSHQIYTETVGLGLKVNGLTFSQTSAACPRSVDQFLKFIKNCSNKNQDDLRKIILTQDIGITRELYPSDGVLFGLSDMRINQLVEFCNKHPKANIHLYLIPWREKSISLRTVFQAYYLLLHIRGYNLGTPFTDCANACFNYFVDGKPNGKELNACNIRFFSSQNILEVEEIRRHLGPLTRTLLYQERFEEVVGWVRQFFVEGL